MTTTRELPEVLRRLGATDVEHRQDRRCSISSTTVRFIKDGRRGVAVGADVVHQLNVFTDLVSLHLGGRHGAPEPDDVWVWYAERPGDRETPVALRVLADSTKNLTVHLRAITPEGKLVEPAGDRVPWCDAAHYQYRQWAELLRAVPDEPPALVSSLVKGTERPEYRAYPMLSSHGRRWSIRFEGLQVAVCSAKGGVLDVGKDRADGRISHHRRRWIEIAGPSPIKLDLTPESLDRAVRVLRELAAAPGVVAGVQDEHALESRILRGAVPLSTPAGEPLELIREHDVVNWGSQFPTRWGVRSSAARYLDGMLKVGRTPWALEMKVAGASGERYYRHAVHQAVLYRDFIRGASPLSDWFDRFDLDQEACEAAVVVPEGGPDEALERLRAVATELGVALMTVPVEHALRPGA